MVSFDLAASELEQGDTRQVSPKVAKSHLDLSSFNTDSAAGTGRPLSPPIMASHNSPAFFSSTPPSASVMDSYNEFHHEGANETRDAPVTENRVQTYKDKRKSYRLEKKKLAEELISAIQDPTIVVLSDWLKVRTTLKQWNKYYCELRPGSLYLYKNQKTHKSSNWIGSVMLKMCELIERPSKKNGFCFKLFHPLEHPIWSPRGPRGEAFTSIMFPLPASSVIFRAPSEEAGRKWMEAIEFVLSNKYSSLIAHKHCSIRDSVPTTPLTATSNGSSNTTPHFQAMSSIDRSDDDILSSAHREERTLFNDSEIEKHFDLCDDVHTDHGEHDDSQEHHTTEDSDDSFFEDDDLTGRIACHRNGAKGQNMDIAETAYTFDGGLEEFGLVGDAGQTEDVPDENKSLLWTLLKQVRPGMDLSKVVLPTFILEPRSFLEKLTDYYYHCDIISKAAIEEDPLLRMKLILKWYLSGFYKKPKGLKKPYNPILGETFRCCWEHPETDSKTFYIAEQVSHHPPVSAFYVTNRKDGFCITGSIMAKSKFYGNSISAILEGRCRLSLLSRGEDYLINFPYAHCKGIFLGPLAFELGGKVMITCAKTGYKTELEFKLKPFFGSEDQCNLVVGKLRLGNETLGAIEGHWDSQIWYKDKRKGESELLWSGIDPKVKSSRLRRFVVPLEEQSETESEKLWSKVTFAIQQQNQETATVEKTILEEAQREAVKQRASKIETWTPNLFIFDTSSSDWAYKLAEDRPWDNRTDIKQYESGYVIRTLVTNTRHLTKKSLFMSSPTGKSDKTVIDGQAVNGPAGTEGSSNRSKMRFRRQVTCADPTSYKARSDSANFFASPRTRSESTASKGGLPNLGNSLDSINSQLNFIKSTLVTLQNEHETVKTEVSQLHTCLRSHGLSLNCQEQHPTVRMSSSSRFSITRFRLGSLFSQVSTEIRQIILVFLAHLFFHTFLPTFFFSSSSQPSAPISLPPVSSLLESPSLSPKVEDKPPIL